MEGRGGGEAQGVAELPQKYYLEAWLLAGPRRGSFCWNTEHWSPDEALISFIESCTSNKKSLKILNTHFLKLPTCISRPIKFHLLVGSQKRYHFVHIAARAS
jgi:hypothetical protein